jgi:hypothetical protein
MTKGLGVALLTVLMLALGACGSQDDDKASKAISDSIMKQQKSTSGSEQSFFSMTRKDADCVGDGLVDEIGSDELQKYGLLTKDKKNMNSLNEVKMPAADAKSATAVFFRCADIVGMMKKAISRTGNLPKQMQACINKAITEKNLRPFFEATLQGKTAEAQKMLTGPMSTCAVGSNG